MYTVFTNRNSLLLKKAIRVGAKSENFCILSVTILHFNRKFIIKFDSEIQRKKNTEILIKGSKNIWKTSVHLRKIYISKGLLRLIINLLMNAVHFLFTRYCHDNCEFSLQLMRPAPTPSPSHYSTFPANIKEHV